MLAMSECGGGKRKRMPVREEGERGMCSLGGYTARYGIMLTLRLGTSNTLEKGCFYVFL